MTLKELSNMNIDDKIKYYNSIEVNEYSEPINEGEKSLGEIVEEYSNFSMSKEDKDKLHEDLKLLSP